MLGIPRGENIVNIAFPFTEFKSVRVGRNNDNELPLEGFAFSRIHTTFSYDVNKEEWYIQDGNGNKNSTNGTWLLLDWSLKIDDWISFRIGANLLRISKLNGIHSNLIV